MHASEAENLPATNEFLQTRNPRRTRRKKNLTGSNKTTSKSLLKPEQVLDGTKTGKSSLRDEERKSALTYREGATFTPSATSQTIPLESLATQLLLEVGGGGAHLHTIKSRGRRAKQCAAQSRRPSPRKPPAILRYRPDGSIEHASPSPACLARIRA